jgi:hypothetical protein
MADASAKIARIANATWRLCLSLSAVLLVVAALCVLLSSTVPQEHFWIDRALPIAVGLATLACISRGIEGLALSLQA